MTEASILRTLQRYSRFIGDDCAVLPVPPRGSELIFTTDFTIEGAHFTREQKPADAGFKAAARSLSDIAAMGGTPLYCLVSLALAPWTDQRWISAFYAGLMPLLQEHKTELAGGDISHAKQLVCDVMICGFVRKGRALLRSGAKPGDRIYVSGPLGGWRVKSRIEPRLELGRRLSGKATACMDISDGLALDLHRLCLASQMSADLENVPLLPGATLAQALHDGEDYELLYTAPPRAKVPGFPIGSITAGNPGTVRYDRKRIKPIGYDHASQRS